MARHEDDFQELRQVAALASRATGREKIAEAVIVAANAVRGLLDEDTPAAVAAKRLLAEDDIGSSDTLDEMLGVLWAALRSSGRVGEDQLAELSAMRHGEGSS